MTILAAGSAQAALTPAQLLVVYNSKSTDATTVLNAYLAAHPDIPGVNVFDLNSSAIANVATVSYANFVTYIRNPIRTYLDLAGDPTPEGIYAILLIRGIPHRIDDTDVALAGDSPDTLASAEFMNGDATEASVDSELVLLWQNLESGEAGGTMDSKSDNLIKNPYHASTAGINTFARNSYLKNQKSFTNSSNYFWTANTLAQAKYRFTAADMYLVCRVDGTTAADAIATISRAQNLHVNKRYVYILLDEDGQQLDDDDLTSPATFSAGPDYEDTRDVFLAAGWNVRYDNDRPTADFIEASEFSNPIIGYASYGENSLVNPPGYGTYIQAGYHFPPGAIFNTLESYNGRAFNGLDALFGQEQAAHFIAAGGTFALGQVWEPFSFSVPDNEFAMTGLLLHGMTWAEAAWSSIPALSWMQIVLGDPLATATIIDVRPDFDGNATVNAADLDIFTACATGPAIGPLASNCTSTDLDGDNDVDQDDYGVFQRCYNEPGTPAIDGCDQ